MSENEKKRPKGFEFIKSTLKHYSCPTLLVIETTTHCNLNCIMCPRDKMTRPGGVMQERVYKKIVDDVALYSPNDTQFWIALMGEPLMLGDLAVERLDYAVKKGLTNVNLNTNLVPADQKLCEDVVKTGINNIIISLDAATEETYNKIRCGGNFNKVLENIDHLLDAKEKLSLSKPDITVQFIIQKDNEHEIELFKELFKDKKVILKIRGLLGWGPTFDAKNLDLPPESRDYPCPWSNRGFAIHVTGQAIQCDAAWDGNFYCGDINHQSIAEIWNGKLAKLREKHWNLDFDYEPCRDCKDWQCGRSELIYCGQE